MKLQPSGLPQLAFRQRAHQPLGQHAPLGLHHLLLPLLLGISRESAEVIGLYAIQADGGQARFFGGHAVLQLLQQAAQPFLQLFGGFLVGDLHLNARPQLGAALCQGLGIHHRGIAGGADLEGSRQAGAQ